MSSAPPRRVDRRGFFRALVGGSSERERELPREGAAITSDARTDARAAPKARASTVPGVVRAEVPFSLENFYRKRELDRPTLDAADIPPKPSRSSS